MDEPGAVLPVPSDPDVVVIGAGVAGLFCAYYLRLAGYGVVVVERGPLGGTQSCSHGNTGFVGTQGVAPLAQPGILAAGLRAVSRPAGPLRVSPRPDGRLLSWLRHFRAACNDEDARNAYRVLLALKKRSLAILHEVCASGPLARTLTARGMILAYRTPREFDSACRSVARAVADGVPLRILEPAELGAMEPGVRFDVAGALYNEEGAFLHVPEFVTELARTLCVMGVRILDHAEVTGFAVADRTVAAVRTVRGEFRPREVVLAAGAWSAACARRLDLSLELQPIKGYAVTLRAPDTALRRPVLLVEAKLAVRPVGDRVRVAGGLELSGLDVRVSRRRVDELLRTARSYVPALERADGIEVWTGLRPCTPDSLPLLGRARPYRNLYVASGHGHVGMGLAPACGRLLAQIVAGEPTDLDVAPLRPDRYPRARRTASARGVAAPGGTRGSGE